MLLRTTVRTVLALALATSASALSGCMVYSEPLHAQSTLVDEGVYVRVRDAHTSGDRVVVRTMMQNQSNKTIVVHRDDVTLRLADGTTVAGTPARHSRKPIVIRPGQSRNVRMSFKAPNGTDVSAAHLVLSGVQVRGEKARRTLGEIALASDHAMLPITRALAAAPRGETESEPEAEPADEASPEEGDSDADPDAAPAEPAVEEGWQVGGS